MRFLDQLDDASRELLVRRGRARTYRPHATRLYEADAAGDVVIVRCGDLKVSRSVEGREIVLDVLHTGDLFGELAALDGRSRSASVIALNAATVVIVPPAAFLEFLADRPDAMMALLRGIAGRLRDASGRQVEYGALDAVGRVCRRLVEMMDRYGVPCGDTAVAVMAPLTQSDIAAWAGLSREAVVKALQRLRRLGWIATTPGVITVLDVDAVTARGST